MAATAFVLGFYTALGWYTANKIIRLIDPPAITQQKGE